MSALTAVIGAIIVFTGGNELAEQNIKDVIQEHPDVIGLSGATSAADLKSLAGGPLWEAMVSECYGSLSARAGIAVFTALCLLIFGLCARNGATWARVLITISGVLALFPHFLVLGDYEPTSVAALSLVALLAAVAAIVLCWLPANSRFARQRRQAS